VFVCSTYDERFSVEAFDCGQPTLTAWLNRHAGVEQAKRTGQVFVWAEEGHRAVLAYFTLSAHEVVAADLPRRLARGMPEGIPAVLLGKLALDRRLHGQGLGGKLLFDAYQRVLAATRTVAARDLVVDAIDDDAVRFYEHYGFIRSPAEPSMRRVRKISDIQADVGTQP
jgi:GNAT superfamily N-acetyltransferase